MATILVEYAGDSKFRVNVSEAEAQSWYDVTLTSEAYERLTGGKVSAEELIRQSFEFLLEREPKESILPRFDLPVIGRYFPEYESEMKKWIEA